MTNNDVLRRVRYVFDFDDAKMVALFGLGGGEVTREQVSAWLKRDEDPAFEACPNVQLATYLNGLIVERRGKKDGPMPVPERRLTNNIVLKKLRIALDLRDDGMLETLKLAGFEFSKHELSALFRKPDHKHFRPCQDQVLRSFLKGMQFKYRTDTAAEE
ncbi:MAG: hypothetical protein ACI9U2_002455 [Bradymonadia bacterium]